MHLTMAVPRLLPLSPRTFAITLALAIIAAWSLSQLVVLAVWWSEGIPNTDWANLADLPAANPYLDSTFRWSPPAGWLWTTLITPLGLVVWRLLHMAVLALLPWRVALVALLTAPFWSDMLNGNVLTFAFVAAWHALEGRRLGIVAFVVMAVLVPRPLMLPVLAWLLWREPFARPVFAASVAAVLGWSLVTGLADDFALRLLHAGRTELDSIWNIAPSRVVGGLWIPIGLALAAWLTLHGRLGLASLAASPYVFTYYVLFMLLELRPSRQLDR